MNMTYLVSQSRAFVQLDEDFAFLASISTWTRLYKRLNSDGFDEYLESNLCNEGKNMEKYFKH